jgi:hypothetical protein
MELPSILLLAAIAGTVFGFLGMFVADQKGRSGGEGFLLGFLFGPLGCLIECLLPNVEAPPSFRTAVRARTVIPEMPEDWGKPKRDEPPSEIHDDGVDMEWLKPSEGSARS